MSVLAAELILNGPASIPEDDVSLTGGARDATARPLDKQLTSSDTLIVVSDNGADTTQTVTVTGRDAAGSIISEAQTLNGVTPVPFASTFERILKAVIDAPAAGTVTLSDGDAGDGTLHDFAAGEVIAFTFFQRSASSPAPETFYEKAFWTNTNGTTDLTTAEVTLTADPLSKIEIGLAAAKDDAATVANRKTAPGGVTFVDDGIAVSVPTGTLGFGEAIGVWVKMALGADDPAAKSSFTLQLDGQTT